MESFRVKNGGCEYVHHLLETVYNEYACLTASSNMLIFLREELTSLPKWFARRFCLPNSISVGMCTNAPFGAGATLDIVHLDRREVGGEPESYITRAVDECKGIPACV